MLRWLRSLTAHPSAAPSLRQAEGEIAQSVPSLLCESFRYLVFNPITFDRVFRQDFVSQANGRVDLTADFAADRQGIRREPTATPLFCKSA
jgi:hypothetical protein